MTYRCPRVSLTHEHFRDCFDIVRLDVCILAFVGDDFKPHLERVDSFLALDFERVDFFRREVVGLLGHENEWRMRLQLIFDGKPEPEVRDILKSNGFKWASWSPSSANSNSLKIRPFPTLL